jgi:hypothetical protein
MVHQIADALRRRLALYFMDRQATWNAIIDALAPERELIAAIENACVDPKNLDTWLAKLAGPLEISSASVLQIPNGQLIAWIIEGASLGIGTRKRACSETPS